MLLTGVRRLRTRRSGWGVLCAACPAPAFDATGESCACTFLSALGMAENTLRVTRCSNNCWRCGEMRRRISFAFGLASLSILTAVLMLLGRWSWNTGTDSIPRKVPPQTSTAARPSARAVHDGHAATFRRNMSSFL